MTAEKHSHLQRLLLSFVLLSSAVAGIAEPAAAQTGKFLEARQAVAEAYTSDPDNPEVAKRYAVTMDVFGSDAGEAYFHLVTELRAKKAPEADVRQALERCLIVAARDSDSDAEAKCQKELQSAGAPARLPHSAAKGAKDGETTIPGGIRALALAAKMSLDVPDQLFALEYSRALMGDAEGNSGKEDLHRLHLYFQTVGGLRKKAQVTPNGLEITLESGSFDKFFKAQEILKLIGWHLSGDIAGSPNNPKIDKVSLQMSSEPEDSEKQVFVSSLGIDFLAVKKALESFQPIHIHLTSETIPIAIDEPFWFGQVMKTKPPAGGLLEGLVDHLAAARFYVALAGMSPDVRQLLLARLKPDRLAQQYSDLLVLYGPSLSLKDSIPDVPGGKTAIPAWGKLAGLSASRPDDFMVAVLERDNGKLLAYYHTLLQLPLANQQFFTRSPERLKAFYDAFPFSEKELIAQHNLIRKGNPFFDLARELPLGDRGEVMFPGGEKAWVPNGAAAGGDSTLLSLLTRKYQAGGVDHYNSEAFLAVVRLERAWNKPMSAEAALMLAKNYPKYHSLYPYFFSFPALDDDKLSQFFNAAYSVESESVLLGGRPALNGIMAQFHGVISLLAIISDTGGLREGDVIQILSSFCKGLPAVTDTPSYIKLTLDTVQQIAGSIARSSAQSSDDRLVDGMSGPARDVTFNAGHDVWTVNRAAWQAKGIRDVLKTQTVTPIDTLVDVYRKISRLTSARGNGLDLLPVIETAAQELREVTPKPEDHLTAQEINYLIQAKPFEIHRLIEEYKKALDNPDPTKDTPPPTPSDLAASIAQAFAPYLRSTLAVWSYAYYTAPNDLAVFEDRYFVRRHRFVPETGDVIWKDTEVQGCGYTMGLCVTGGLAELGAAAGSWGRTKLESAENLHLDTFNQAELASIRTIPWSKVSPDATHLVALQIRAGKEIIVLGASDAALRSLIDENLMGLAGGIRRVQIAEALDSGNPAAALELLSSSDLYWLAESMRNNIKQMKLTGPVFEAFIAEDPVEARRAAGYFGGSHWQTYGSTRPQIVNPGPCEEYERLSRKDPLWECASHIVLNVAEAADRDGIPVDAAALLLESALREAGSNLQGNPDDWQAAIRAMNRIRLVDLLPELRKIP